FMGVRGFVRETSIPSLAPYGTFAPDAHTRDVRTTAYFNVIAARHVGLSAAETFLRDKTQNYHRTDKQNRAGINLVHERGLLVGITTSYITQDFSNTLVPMLPRSSFGVTNLNLQYEFSQKRGLFSLTLSNALDRTFQSIVDSISVNPILPQ